MEQEQQDQLPLETTIVTREYPVPHVDGVNNPYYPMIFGKYLSQFRLYQPLMQAEKKTVFTGRTATYEYLTIDETIIKTAKKLQKFGIYDKILTKQNQ